MLWLSWLPYSIKNNKQKIKPKKQTKNKTKTIKNNKQNNKQKQNTINTYKSRRNFKTMVQPSRRGKTRTTMLFPYLLICSYILPYSPMLCFLCFCWFVFFGGLCFFFCFLLVFFHNIYCFPFSNEWRSLDVITLLVWCCIISQNRFEWCFFLENDIMY